MRTCFALVFLMLFSNSLLFGDSKDNKIIVTIHIPMDNRGDTQTGHVVLKYWLDESGTAVNVRDVYDWAHQDSLTKRLTKEELKKAQSIVQRLPVRSAKVPKNQSVIVTENFPDGEKVRVYDRAKLPATMKELFALLGGIRLEVRDRLQFDPELLAPSDRTQPAPTRPSASGK